MWDISFDSKIQMRSGKFYYNTIIKKDYEFHMIAHSNCVLLIRLQWMNMAIQRMLSLFPVLVTVAQFNKRSLIKLFAL